MAKKGNKYKIGALALIAIVILVLGLLSLGIMKYFQPEILFMTSTNNSVQGLKVGSNVKIKGVTIGAVKKIKIGLDGEVIYITMQLDIDSLLSQTQGQFILKSRDIKQKIEEKIKRFVQKGLRCQLQYEGITGDMYIDMAYSDPTESPVEQVTLPEDHPIYIPLIPTPTIGNILQSAQEIAKKLNDINLNKISQNFDNLIVSLNDFTTQLKEIVNREKIDEIGDSINFSLTKFNQTMASLNTLINMVEIQPSSLVWGKTGSKVVPSLNNQ